LFKTTYPDIYEKFALVKRKEINELAILLQNIESEIIIENEGMLKLLELGT
jgi:hypothetical protein